MISSGRLNDEGEFVGELVPNVAEEVLALGFGVEELLVLVCGEGEVAVNLAALEAQVKDAPRHLVGLGRQEFRVKGLQSRFNFSVSFRFVPTIRNLWARLL